MAANTWSTGPPMSTARSFHSCNLVKDKVVVVGGWAYETNETISDTEIYDVNSQAWSSGASQLELGMTIKILIVDQRLGGSPFQKVYH